MADLSALERTNEPQLMVILDPITHKPFLNDNGEQMGFMVTDDESEACEKVKREFANQWAGSDKEAPYAARKQAGTDLLAAAVVAYVNLQWDKKVLNGEAKKKQTRKILEAMPVVRKQLNKYVGADEHFLAGATEASDNG